MSRTVCIDCKFLNEGSSAYVQRPYKRTCWQNEQRVPFASLSLDSFLGLQRVGIWSGNGFGYFYPGSIGTISGIFLHSL